MFPPSKNEAFDQKMHVNYSIPPISEDYLKLWLQNTPKTSTNLSIEDDYASIFHSEKSNPSENSSLENTVVHGSENAISSNTQSCNTTQTGKYHGVGGKEGIKAGEECKRHKRQRSTQEHNLNERIRRKKLTEKMMALQEMIPNSIKRDQASTLDDAIKYIKTLQYLVQMWIEAGHTSFHSPGAMLPLEGQRGLFPIPNSYGMWTGMSIGYPVELPNPWLFRSSTTSSGLQSVQNNCGEFPMYADSISYFGI